MRRFWFSFLLVCAAHGASAATHVDRPLFECTVQNGAKELYVSYNPPFVYYGFGPVGSPELTIEKHILDLDVIPWNGVGRSIHEQVRFRVGEYVYTVYQAFDRTDHVRYGGVTVTENGVDILHLPCDPGGEVESAFVFFDTKSDAGQCWDLDENIWKMTCDSE